MSKIELNNLDIMKKYLKCFEKINLNENKYNKYLSEKINIYSLLIKTNIYTCFSIHYVKKNTIEDLLYVLKKMQSFEISDENINEYMTNYINDIIKHKISLIIKDNIYASFLIHYEKKNTIEDLIICIKKMQLFEISNIDINKFATNYINDIITNKIIFIIKHYL